jgi:hypothetical protein
LDYHQLVLLSDRAEVIHRYTKAKQGDIHGMQCAVSLKVQKVFRQFAGLGGHIGLERPVASMDEGMTVWKKYFAQWLEGLPSQPLVDAIRFCDNIEPRAFSLIV